MHDSQFPQSAIPYYGWIPRFIEYVRDFSSAPTQYVYFTALLVLGLVLGRKAYIEQGDEWIFPNLYILLLGGPSSFKSSTWKIGRRILAKHDNRLILPEDTTNESFKRLLINTPTALYPMDEIGVFLKQAKASYRDEIKEALTYLYDCPPIYRIARQGDGESNIEKPFIGIAATSTFDWLVNNINEADLKSGFLPRFLFVPSWENGDRIPLQPSADKMKQYSLLEGLKKLHEMPAIKSGVGMSDDAKKVYLEWDAWWWQVYKRVEERISPLYSKLPQFVLKMSLLIELSDFENFKGQITMDSMKHATEAIRYLMGQYEKIAMEFGFTPFEKDKNKIIRILDNGGNWVSRAILLRYGHVKSKYLNEILQTLIESGLVERSRKVPDGSGSGRRIEMFRLSDDADERICLVGGSPVGTNDAVGAISQGLRWGVFKRDGYKCVKCGGEYDLVVDHIVDISDGGSNTIDNLQTLCRPCNTKKGNSQ